MLLSQPSQINLQDFPLGRLILAQRSLQEPAKEYQDLNTEIEVTATTTTNSKYLDQNERNTHSKLHSKFLSGRYFSHKSRETLVKGAVQYVCRVRNSEVTLKKAMNCQENGVRIQKWLREKAKLRRRVYMIVGFCTLKNPRVEEMTAYKRSLKAAVVDPVSILSSLVGFQMLPEYTLKLTFSLNSIEEEDSIAKFQAMGECVWAVQYQRVERAWSTRGTPDKPRLTETRWVVAVLCRGMAVGFTRLSAWEPSKGDCELVHSFKNIEKEGPIGYGFHSLPYYGFHRICKEGGIRVGCVFHFPRLGL